MPEQAVLRLHDLPPEARRLKQETEALLAEIEIRGRTTALMLRAKDLRPRTRRVAGVLAYTKSYMTAVRIAFRERTGRPLEPGMLYTGGDLERAAAIVAAEELRAGKC